MRFVYFDVGGVLVKDFSATKKWSELLSEWNVPNDKKDEVTIEFGKFEIESTKGRSVEEFKMILKEKWGVSVKENCVLLNGFVNRFEKNEEIWETVGELTKKYRLGLLTNMYPGMLDLIETKGLLPKIDWQVIIDSSVIGYKKPEREIYDIAEVKTGFDPGEILFIDNTKENLIKAEEKGWRVFCFDSANYEQSNRELKDLLG